MSLFRGGGLNVAPPLDGITPIFEEAGAAPDADFLRPPGSIVRFQTAYYWQAGTLTDPVWLPLNSDVVNGLPVSGLALSVAAQDVRSFWMARARAALGNPDPSTFFFEFVMLPLRAFTGSGGFGINTIGTAGTRTGSGRRVLNTKPANVNSGFKYSFSFIATGSGLTPIFAGDAEKWWMGGRWKNTTAMPAGCDAGMSLHVSPAGDATKELLMGVCNGAANYRMEGAVGAAIDSGVAVDQTEHTHEGWHDGNDSFYRIDLAATPSTGDARPSANSNPGFLFFDTSAVQRTLEMAWMAAALVISDM